MGVNTRVVYTPRNILCLLLLLVDTDLTAYYSRTDSWPPLTRTTSARLRRFSATNLTINLVTERILCVFRTTLRGKRTPGIYILQIHNTSSTILILLAITGPFPFRDKEDYRANLIGRSGWI